VTARQVLGAATSFLAIFLGVILLIVPWSSLWDSNHFLEYAPYLQPYLLTDAARYSVAGLGLLDLFVGITEARRMRTHRDR
jgi:hypothetical protein